jgi:cyanophycin synthetase
LLDIGRMWALRGPNIWGDCPVLELTLGLGGTAAGSHAETQARGQALWQRLCAWLPGLAGRGAPADACQGSGLAETFVLTALEVQTLAGSRVALGRVGVGEAPRVFLAAVEFDEEAVGRACVETTRALVDAALLDADPDSPAELPFDLESEIARLRTLCQDVHLGPSTGAIARAARARGIPVRRLGKDNLLLLGHAARQRRVWTAETDRTGAIAEAIAQDKDLTRLLLGSVGVPVPRGYAVSSPEDAWAAAQEIGLPVVIKPRFGNHGRGISADLNTRERVEQAFAAALAEGTEVLCERHIRGADHRLLVVGDRVVAAALREPAQVFGDGEATVAELVERVNRDPRRSDGHGTVLSFIKIDPIALAILAEQGQAPDSVPAAGARVLLRSTANLSTGGTATDVTDLVHPEVAARAVDAARVVGLDIAGVDVLAQDIRVPLEAQGGAVVEVNAGPGLRMHLEPSSGRPRPVGEAICELLFPPGEDGRIPVVAVIGGNGAVSAASTLIAGILRHQGHRVGVASRAGLSIGERQIEQGDCARPDSACAVLLNPLVEMAVLAATLAGIRRQGLPFDRCQVAVVMDEGVDQLGQPGLATADDLTRTQRCLLACVPAEGTAVLNADDARIAGLAGACGGAVLWFSRDPANPLVREHCARGGRALVEREGHLVLMTAATQEDLAPLASLAGAGPAEALAAAAAALALGLTPDAVAAGLRDPNL